MSAAKMVDGKVGRGGVVVDRSSGWQNWGGNNAGNDIFRFMMEILGDVDVWCIDTITH